MNLTKKGNGRKSENGYIIVENCGYVDYDNPNKEVVEPLRLDNPYQFDFPIWAHDTRDTRAEGMHLAFYHDKEVAERMCTAIQKKEDRYHKKFEVMKMEIVWKISR